MWFVAKHEVENFYVKVILRIILNAYEASNIAMQDAGLLVLMNLHISNIDYDNLTWKI